MRDRDEMDEMDRQWRGSSTDRNFCILIRTRGNPYPWIRQARIFPTDQSPTDTGMSLRSMCTALCGVDCSQSLVFYMVV